MVRGSVWMTSYPGQLSLGSEFPHGGPAVPADSDLGPRICGVDQLSRQNQSWTGVPAGLTSCPSRLRPGSKELWGQPAIPAKSAPAPCSHGVDQLSRPIWSWGRTDAVPGDSDWVQDSVVSTSAPGKVSHGSELTRGQPAVPVDSIPGLRRCVVDQLS